MKKYKFEISYRMSDGSVYKDYTDYMEVENTVDDKIDMLLDTIVSHNYFRMSRVHNVALNVANISSVRIDVSGVIEE